MPFGIGLGLWLFQELPQKWVQVFIGGFILLSLSSHSLKSFQEKELKLWMFIPAGFVVGALNIVIGVVGPILGILLIGRELSRQSIVSTTSVFSFLGHILKVVGIVLIGFNFAKYAAAMFAMLPSIVLGTYFGHYLLGRSSDLILRNS